MFIPITKDECFYNFKCLRPMSGLLPFNSVLSNISYVGAGFNASSSLAREHSLAIVTFSLFFSSLSSFRGLRE